MKRSSTTELNDAMKRVRLTRARPKRPRSASPDARPRGRRKRDAPTALADCADACAHRASAFARAAPLLDARRALAELQAETKELWRADKALRRGLQRTYAENDRLRRANAELLRRVNVAEQLSLRQSRQLNEVEAALPGAQWVC